jgi:hypothetical protein
MFPEWLYAHGLPCAENNDAALEGGRGGTRYCTDPVALHEDDIFGVCCNEGAPGLAPMGEA